MAIGVSFLDDQNAQGDKKPDRFQQAVEVLSMRVPRIVGGGAIAPAPLLQGMGGSGSPFAHTAVQQALAQMAGLPLPSGPMGMPSAPSPMGPGQPSLAPRGPLPTPRVIPGIDTLPGPTPAGPVAREWQAPESAPMAHTGDVQEAAVRASRGYQDFLRAKQDPWMSGRLVP